MLFVWVQMSRLTQCRGLYRSTFNKPTPPSVSGDYNTYSSSTFSVVRLRRGQTHIRYRWNRMTFYFSNFGTTISLFLKLDWIVEINCSRETSGRGGQPNLLIYRASQNIYPQGFLAVFFQRLRILNGNFAHPLYVHIDTKFNLYLKQSFAILSVII